MRKHFASDAKVASLGFAERLSVFLQTADAESFSLAGRRLGLAPSSVARQIDALEAELGSRLFHRSTRRLTLTDAGELLRTRGLPALVELEDVRAVVSALDTEPRGRLRLAVPVTFGQRHVVPHVAQFLECYPRVDLEVSLDDRFVDLVDQRIDLAVRIGVLPDSSLLATRIAPQIRVACAAPAYLDRGGKPERPEDLSEHDCLTTPGQPIEGWWIFGGQPKAPRLSVRGRFMCRNTDALYTAALDGVGIAHLPTWLVGEALKEGRLVRLFANRPLAEEVSSIYFVRRPGPAVPKVRVMIEFLRTCFGSPPHWDRGL